MISSARQDKYCSYTSLPFSHPPFLSISLSLSLFCEREWVKVSFPDAHRAITIFSLGIRGPGLGPFTLTLAELTPPFLSTSGFFFSLLPSFFPFVDVRSIYEGFRAAFPSVTI